MFIYLGSRNEVVSGSKLKLKKKKKLKKVKFKFLKKEFLVSVFKGFKKEAEDMLLDYGDSF